MPPPLSPSAEAIEPTLKIRTRRNHLASTLEKLWLPLLGIPLDAVMVTAAFASAFFLRFEFRAILRMFPVPGGRPLPWSYYSDALPGLVAVWILIYLYAGRLYHEPFLRMEDKAVRILSGTVQATLATLALSFWSRRFSDSRLLFVLMVPLATVYVFTGHALLQKLHRFVLGGVKELPNLLLVGTGPTANLVKRQLEKSRHRRLHLLDADGKAQVLRCVAEKEIDEVILCRTNLCKEELVELAEVLETAEVRLQIVPSLLELRMGEVQIDQSLGLPMIRLHHVSLSGANFAVKRVFDAAFCLLVGLLGVVPFALIAVLIKLDSRGPVLYKQRRYGYKGRMFEAFKFRTMSADAESKIQQLRDSSGDAGPYFKLKADPRITRVGWWLRRLSLDEFPQFLNVMRGEMAVVGPRPLAVSTGELESLQEHFGPTARKMLNVRPGITGLWQVSGRNEVDADDRFALDLYYIEHWSLGLDLKVILKTVPAMLLSRGAY